MGEEIKKRKELSGENKEFKSAAVARAGPRVVGEQRQELPKHMLTVGPRKLGVARK